MPNGIAELHMFSMIAEGTERSGPGSSVPLLPINGKYKDNRTKEEHHKLMNGNSEFLFLHVAWWLLGGYH